MPTTVHLPPDLLVSVDQRAEELGLSRNRYIILALETAVAEETDWSPAFLRALEEATADKESRAAIDQMRKTIRKRRSGKGPPRL